MSYEPKVYLSRDRIVVTDEFISRNSLKLRPYEEITKKLRTVISEAKMFEFRHEVLSDYVTFDVVRDMLEAAYVAKIDSGEVVWEQITTIEDAAQDFLDYMNFAWGKAEDGRGLSAARSVFKLSAWLWVMSREDIQDILLDDRLYNPYGAPALITVCREMGIAVPASLIEFAKKPV